MSTPEAILASPTLFAAVKLRKAAAGVKWWAVLAAEVLLVGAVAVSTRKRKAER